MVYLSILFRTSNLLPLSQSLIDLLPFSQSDIRKIWYQFAYRINEGFVTLINLFRDLGTWGWLWVVFGVWYIAMYLWIREYPRALRLIYFLVLLFYFIASIFLFVKGYH